MKKKIIVIHGFFNNGPLGLMNTAKSTYSALKEKYSVIKNNISYPVLIKFNKIMLCSDLEKLNKDDNFIHIFILQPHHSRILINKILLKNKNKNNYFIGYWPWELSKWPKIWCEDLMLVDEIWCLSKFIYDSIPKLHFQTNKFVMHPGFRIKRNIKKNSSTKKYKFLFSFDPRSKFKRKNPEGTTMAFWNAFGFPFDMNKNYFHKDVSLTLKLINAPKFKNGLEEIMQLINEDKRINLIKEKLTYENLINLYKNHDCYISLHKSEGFGNAIAENLILGNEVITTNYSGVKDFCSEENSYLIDFYLENVIKNYPHSSKNSLWAVPNIKEASRVMLNLKKNRIIKNIKGPTVDLSINGFSKRINERIEKIIV